MAIQKKTASRKPHVPTKSETRRSATPKASNLKKEKYPEQAAKQNTPPPSSARIRTKLNDQKIEKNTSNKSIGFVPKKDNGHTAPSVPEKKAEITPVKYKASPIKTPTTEVPLKQKPEKQIVNQIHKNSVENIKNRLNTLKMAEPSNPFKQSLEGTDHKYNQNEIEYDSEKAITDIRSLCMILALPIRKEPEKRPFLSDTFGGPPTSPGFTRQKSIEDEFNRKNSQKSVERCT